MGEEEEGKTRSMRVGIECLFMLLLARARYSISLRISSIKETSTMPILRP
jgi:hypothetical protein